MLVQEACNGVSVGEHAGDVAARREGSQHAPHAHLMQLAAFLAIRVVLLHAVRVSCTQPYACIDGGACVYVYFKKKDGGACGMKRHAR